MLKYHVWAKVGPEIVLVARTETGVDATTVANNWTSCYVTCEGVFHLVKNFDMSEFREMLNSQELHAL